MMGQTFLLVVLGYLTLAFGCDECGDECRKMCGTKQFKTCCFNYLRKRSMMPESGPDLKLEVSLAKNGQRGELTPYLAYMASMFQYPLAAAYQNIKANAKNNNMNSADPQTLQFLYDT